MKLESKMSEINIVVISISYINYKLNKIKCLTAYQVCYIFNSTKERNNQPRRYTMTNSEYTKKWNRDEDDNFATFLTNWHAGDMVIIDGIEDLEESDIENADPIDMADWGITDPQEWIDAYSVAITELRK